MSRKSFSIFWFRLKYLINLSKSKSDMVVNLFSVRVLKLERLTFSFLIVSGYLFKLEPRYFISSFKAIKSFNEDKTLFR